MMTAVNDMQLKVMIQGSNSEMTAPKRCYLKHPKPIVLFVR